MFSQWLTPPKALILGIALLIGIGTFLLSLPAATADGNPLHWLDALFTAASALCVTGLTVVDTGTHFSLFGQIILLILIQIGGVGFVTMAVVVSVLIGRRVGLRERLLVQESLGQVKFQGMVRLALYTFLLALVAEFAGMVLLWFRWQADLGPPRAFWFAVFHSVSAFTNAGFDLFSAVGESSLHGYRSDILVNVVIGGLIVVGSLGLPVLNEIIRWHRTRRFSLHSSLVLVTSSLLLVGGGILLLITEMTPNSLFAQMTFGERVLVSLFQSASARTGGLTTVSLVEMNPAAWFVLMTLMFIGAATASMGGGVKVNVLGALLATLWSVARGREEIKAFDRTIPRETVYKALAVMMGSATFVMIMTIAINVSESLDPLLLMFEVVSAFGTVGYSLGVTPHLSDVGKILIVITMFVGRLGPLTLIAAIARRHKTIQLIHYPEEKILVG